MRARIGLKFGTRKGLIKADLSTNFGRNPMNIQGVITDYLRKIKSKACHTYRINPLICRWNNHRRSAFLWFERNRHNDHGDMTQNPTCVKIRPMKLDYQFLAQIFENLMRAGGYYSLFFQKHNTHPNMKISAKKQ